MKKTITTLFLAVSLIFTACNAEQKEEAREEIQEIKEELGMEEDDDDDAIVYDFSDKGGEISLFDIEKYTKKNENFRTTVWTGNNIQMTLMSIPVGGDIGKEIHTNIEQFIRVESGKGMVYIGDTEDEYNFQQEIKDDEAVFIPVGKWHNIKNIGDKPLKLYSIYGPVEHARGTVHVTMEEGHAHDHDH